MTDTDNKCEDIDRYIDNGSMAVTESVMTVSVTVTDAVWPRPWWNYIDGCSDTSMCNYNH